MKVTGICIKAIGFRGELSLVILAMMIGVMSGCGSTKLTHTPRAATEQLLLTNAWDAALSQVDFSPLAGVPVFVDAAHVPSTVDQGWLTSSIRQAMASQGVLLRSKPEQAQWVCEARVGAYGTDSYDWMIGIPQFTIPATIAGLPTGTIPEVPVVKNNDQRAYAKLALFAYDRTSGQLVWKSGTNIAGADSKNLYIGSIGPIQSGSIHKSTRINGIEIPAIADAISLSNKNIGEKVNSLQSKALPTAIQSHINVSVSKAWDEDFRP